MTGTVDRRRFLRAAGVTAVGAAAAGVGGELLLGNEFRKAPPASMAPAGPTAPPPELKIDPMTPLPADETLDNIAGLSPFYTPNTEFYRVDTSLVLPKVSSRDWQLRIHGMVDRPMTLSYDDLIRMPMIDRDITLTCVSQAVGGNFIGNARGRARCWRRSCARRAPTRGGPDLHPQRGWFDQPRRHRTALDGRD